MNGSTGRTSATQAELQALRDVIIAITHEALAMVLKTAPSMRAAEMIALHACIPDRLILLGVAPDRAPELAKRIRVTVDLASDLD
jgi:hypothetical protein